MHGTMKKLNEKALLVKLTRRKANLVRRDTEAEAIIQQQMGDASLVVNSKLFRDKANPINQIVAAFDEVYTYHKRHTLPYIDVGPRIVPTTQYFEYAQVMREKLAAIETLMDKYMPNYSKYVDMDMLYRNQGQAVGRARSTDYPTAEQFRAAMSADLRFQPLPDTSHFLYDISEEDVAAFERSLEEAANTARNDVIWRMLEPLKHLADTLQHPIGSTDKATGKRLGIFRDSTVENVVDGVAMARRLAIDPSPELQEAMDELESTIKAYDQVKHQLRESPIVREQAAKKLADVAAKMSAFMGAV
jgi:hypothetical protein